MPAELRDGVEFISGVSGAHPNICPRNLATNAVNRYFRHDINSTRLPIQHIELIYPEDVGNKQRFLLEGGNIQGSTVYNSLPPQNNSQIILSVAGTIFRIKVIGKKGYVYKLFEGNDPVLTHAWFAQAFEWLIIQDGMAQPILWDGVTARRAFVAPDGTSQEVPVGSVMAFIHGRLAVASADGTNQIAVGDIVYGENVTTTADVIRFTETQYWASGGAFGVPVYVGDITGMYAMPYLDTGTGQNELVVLGTQGAVAIDLSRPREQWLDSQLLRISLIGAGCVSTHSLAALNGDLFFRSTEGVRSYRNARSEFQQTWHQTPISTDVRRWIATDSPRLLEYNSQVAWRNLLLSTCSPLLARPNNPLAGHHRFHRGFVVFDAEPQSNVLRSGAPVWHGMWTGIRPVCFIEGRIENRHRCFAWSYDRDGVNRLYEVNEDGFNDTFEGHPRKIFSFYDTSSLGVVERTTNSYDQKILASGEIEVSGLREQTELTVSIRPDNSPCFVEVDQQSVGCECDQPNDCFTFSQPRSDRRIIAGIDDKCIPGTNQRLKNVRLWQARVIMRGFAKVERMFFWFERDTQQRRKDCAPDQCLPVDCCPNADDYTYHIAPEGENLNVPILPQPSDVELLFSSTKSFTARCPPETIGASVTATGTATSTVSQIDADIKASNLARDAANALISCRSCSGRILATETVNNSSFDFSSFFAVGAFVGSEGFPFRLIDVQTLAVYVLGIIDSTGTMVPTYALTTGNDTFDVVTKMFTDTSGTSPSVSFQVGCPGQGGGAEGGQTEWPDQDHYGY